MNIVLPASVEAAFRAEVFARKGMRKGNISDAMTEAIELWIKTAGAGTPATRRATSAHRADPQAAAMRRMKPLDRMSLAHKLSRFSRGAR